MIDSYKNFININVYDKIDNIYTLFNNRLNEKIEDDIKKFDEINEKQIK